MDERDELLATVASLYYRINQSQAEIAERMGVSTSKISRMLKEARERGIVDIRIFIPIPRNVELEQELVAAFGLKDAIVSQAGSESDDGALLRSTGQLAGNFLQRSISALPTGSSVGVAWGASVQAAINALPEMPNQQCDVAQLMGGVGSYTVDGPDLSRVLAVKLGGRHYDLHAPLLVEQAASCEILMGEPAVREGLARAKRVKLAITGIGAVQENASSFLRAGLMTRNDLANLREQGAIGEMVGRFFATDGSSESIEINQRIIGIELDDLRRIPLVLAVARGMPKVEAIYGALAGRYLNVLATDEGTARGLLAMAQLGG